MEKDTLLRQLRQAFAEELTLHLGTLNEGLLALERDPEAATDDRWRTLLRAAHTIKGGARAVDALALSELAHRMEDLLLAMRDRRIPLQPTLFAMLFRALDVVAVAGAEPDARTTPALHALVEELARQQPEPSAAPATIPLAAPPAAIAPLETSARVSGAKLDALLTRAGELLSACARYELIDERMAEVGERLRTGVHEAGPTRTPATRALIEASTLVAQIARQLAAERRALELASTELSDRVRGLRLLPLREGTAGLERVARDAAAGTDKVVDLVVEGGDVEMDRSVLEGLRAPLAHLVRNAIDHGLEPPDERQRRGKPERGRVTVSARVMGGHVELVVSDDGAGLDLDRLRAALHARGREIPHDPVALAETIFEPGLSTARAVTELSGRGMGLDIVRSQVEALRGIVEVTSQAGHGTRFVLTLPLTLISQRAVLVRAEGQLFALPSAQVSRLLRARPAELPVVDGRQRLLGDDGPLPTTWLAELLGLGAPRGAAATIPFVLCEAAGQTVALAVDELVDERELVVKRLGPRLGGSRALAGGAVLPGGELVLILDVAQLVRLVERQPAGVLLPEPSTSTPVRRRILLADDSLTTRSLERSILEAAGYQVTTASDGAEAWRLLEQQGADAVVSDIEMPNMDGFELVRTVRASRRFTALPVVLVTGLGSDADRARGLELGADAYVVKSGFDQGNLLDILAQLLRE